MRKLLDLRGTVAAASVILLVAPGLPVSPFARVAAQDVAITEFLALGGDVVDEDGDAPDWIEICNRGTSAVDLGGWYLTDDAGDLRKWRLPDTPLAAADYLLVLASGKDRADAGFELHTNFRLSGAGEYLALVMPDGSTVAHEYAAAYPQQIEDLSYGVLEGSPLEEERYFREPTPGAPNGVTGVIAFVADTRFSQPRGFYDAPFEVAITTATEGAEIRYTVDGTPPTASSGLVYEGPIRIDRTTTLQARGFRPDLEPTDVDAHTYIFLDDVILQTRQATLEAGFPTSWGGTTPDYGMDPDVIGPNDRFGGIYAETIRDDLKSLPSLSIVMNIDDLFGPSGIYTNSEERGERWERAASVELIFPDGSEGFQVNCGIRIQGGWFRRHSGTRKHSFRLLFKRDYGPTKLRFPLFGDDAVRRFDTITLRGGANDGYSWSAARLTEQYTRDEFGRSLQRATGNASARGIFVHLYINGIYWGLYNPVERPDHSFSASYYGGHKDEWDAIHDGLPTNGNTARWTEMVRKAAEARTSLAAYLELQGRNPDRTPNPDYPRLLDVPNYVDYLIVNLWGGNWDWPWKNWWAGRDRSEASTGFKFYCWDYENTIGNNRDRSPLTKDALQNEFTGAGVPHQSLRQNLEYRLLFADRVHRFFFNGGCLTPESLIPRYEAIAAAVERAIVAESARWGDQHHHPPLTLSEWYTERDWILGTYLPRRSAIVLQQFRRAGLYPAVEAPTFSRPGGRIDPGFRLLPVAPAGEVYYTLDGSDPRLPGGAVSDVALVADLDSVVLLEPGVDVRLAVPEDETLGEDWFEPGFDDAGWVEGRTGIGFDLGDDFDDLIQTDVEDLMHDKSGSIFLRIRFDADAALFERGQPALALMTLRMMYDDGYVAYLNGTRVAARNAPESPAWNSHAARSHSDGAAVVFEDFSLNDAIPVLRPGENLLAIHGLNFSAGSPDFLIVPQLEGVSAASGIALEESTVVKARALNGDTWSALNEATFIVDTPLRVTEIMYHPARPLGVSPYDESDFEFIELQNIGDERLDLSGVRLQGGIEFDFAGSDVSSLAPGSIVVVVRNRDAFSSRYDAAGMLVAGQYRGKLDNRGDSITLRGAFAEAILDFSYSDAWHPSTDGQGPSLVIADYRQDASTWGEAANWRPSEFLIGSPGVDETGSDDIVGRQRPGDLNQDVRLDVSDAVALLFYLFRGVPRSLPCGDGSLDGEGNRALIDSNGDGAINLSDASFVLSYLFLGGPLPALGTDCVPIRGCPDACR